MGWRVAIYEEARKQVLKINTMFAFARDFYNHGSIRPKLQNWIYGAHQIFEIYKKSTKLCQKMWNISPKMVICETVRENLMWFVKIMMILVKMFEKSPFWGKNFHIFSHKFVNFL